MLLAMATAVGWSGPASSAQASRPVVQIAAPQQVTLPTLVAASSVVRPASGEWRYVSTRR